MNGTDGPKQVRAKTVRGSGTQVGGNPTNQDLPGNVIEIETQQ